MYSLQIVEKLLSDGSAVYDLHLGDESNTIYIFAMDLEDAYKKQAALASVIQPLDIKETILAKGE